jgi:hypothetical protein
MTETNNNCVACGKDTHGGNHTCVLCGCVVHNSAYSYNAATLGGNEKEYCSLASLEEEGEITCTYFRKDSTILNRYVLGCPCLLKDEPEFSLYVVPAGYNINSSVYAVDNDFASSQDMPKSSVPEGNSKKDYKGESQETAREKATVVEGNSKKDDQNEGKKPAPGNEETDGGMGIQDDTDTFVRWTPGVVRYAATHLVEANWDCLHEFVECSGDPSTEKLATFKRGMAKHGVTEVSPIEHMC